ncbi:MAG: hypothetical protein VR64_10285 [Desulfatitalea sp. BRH_c12]|nr:MAG: hypothetical protein VR64_10285 [Desulfatitalea sp. BRH_c12]
MKRTLSYFGTAEKKFLFACLLAGTILAGCAPSRSLIVLLPEADGKVGKIDVQSRGGTVRVDQPYHAVDVGSTEIPAHKQMTQVEIASRFEGALAVEPTQRYQLNVSILYCLRGDTALTPQSQKDLTALVAKLKKGPRPIDIYLVGHADRLGPESYNLALSQRRASAMRTVFLSCGFAPDIITISAMGESSPLVETEDDIEAPMNRRVEIVVKSRKAE